MSATPGQAIDAVGEAFGRHPGYRALHAKGTLLKGTFRAAPDAAGLSRAGHLQGPPVPVTVRVSNGGGNPEVPDYVPDVRGLAVKFYLPDGSRTDIVAASLPRFAFHAADPFLDLIRLRATVKAAPGLLRALARQPSAIPSMIADGPALLLGPASYATIPYYAIHAYRFIDAVGGSRYVRYTLRPEARVQRLAAWTAWRRGPDYVQEEIRARVAAGAVRFSVEAQIAGPGDDPDDPHAAWPRDRLRVGLGTIELTGLDTTRETGGDVLVFDPSRVVDGIECSNDPVLRFRTAAYSESIARRTAS